MFLEILEFVLGLVLEVFGDILVEVLIDLGLGSVKAALGRENRNPVLATVGYLLAGGILGFLSASLFPERILRPGPIPGLSLILAPVVAGAAMRSWGQYRRDHGHSTTNLATWYGGGALALGIALVRYIRIP